MMYTQLCNGAEFLVCPLVGRTSAHWGTQQNLRLLPSWLSIGARSSLSRRNVTVAIRHINSLPLNLPTPLWWIVLTAAQLWYGLMALFYTTPQSSNMNADVASYSLLNIKTAIMTSCLLSQRCSNSNSENENKQGRWDMHLFFRPWKHEKVLRRNPWFVCYSRRRR